MNVPTLWSGVQVFAQYAGEVDPYDQTNVALFRGEEAFAPHVTGIARWSKPSPEPQLDDTFHSLVLDSIQRKSATIAHLVATLAQAMLNAQRVDGFAHMQEPPLLIAILRAGVPIATLLAQYLQRWFDAEIPVVALSLFTGLGWDDVALIAALNAYPGRRVWFIDGWTGRGGVARELQESYQRWKDRGLPDFTNGQGPAFAVLCDPAGVAYVSGTQADYFVPSACFTAPETLGFSRGFATEEGKMFSVYAYPHRFFQPAYLNMWAEIAHTPWREVANVAWRSVACNGSPSNVSRLPTNYRIHSNEVVRALINRSPQEVLFCDDEATVAETFAPISYLCQMRNVPMRYACSELVAWGTSVAARMSGAG